LFYSFYFVREETDALEGSSNAVQRLQPIDVRVAISVVFLVGSK